MLKDSLKGLFCVNTRINEMFYDAFGSHGHQYLDLVRKFGAVDSIDDIQGLRELRSSVDEGQQFYTTNANASNSLIYGIWESMFAAHRTEPIYYSPAVEHGLIIHDQIYTDLRFTARAGLVTFGDYRYRQIRKYKNEPIYEVGPYIHYAQPYYDAERTAELKKTNGKTLLVFPAHSVDTSTISQDENRYLDEVLRIADKGGFETVLVNAFWWNVNDPVIHKFESEGFKIVSAGFRDDVNFLPRLRTIMDLSDLIAGDSFGTHIGYALDRKVPFQFIDINTHGGSIDDKVDPHADENASLKEKLARAFLGASEITKHQVDLLEPYWGFSKTKSREQIEDIYQITRRIVRESGMGGGWSRHFHARACELLKEYELTDKAKAELLRQALRP